LACGNERRERKKMSTYDHRVTIPTDPTSMKLLLEHIRYSDSRIRTVSLVPDNLHPEKFVVNLWYKGTAKGWKTAKKRAESIGLMIEEGYFQR
jgi:hypothetical protein